MYKDHTTSDFEKRNDWIPRYSSWPLPNVAEILSWNRWCTEWLTCWSCSVCYENEYTREVMTADWNDPVWTYTCDVGVFNADWPRSDMTLAGGERMVESWDGGGNGWVGSVAIGLYYTQVLLKMMRRYDPVWTDVTMVLNKGILSEQLLQKLLVDSHVLKMMVWSVLREDGACESTAWWIHSNEVAVDYGRWRGGDHNSMDSVGMSFHKMMLKITARYDSWEQLMMMMVLMMMMMMMMMMVVISAWCDGEHCQSWSPQHHCIYEGVCHWTSNQCERLQDKNDKTLTRAV